MKNFLFTIALAAATVCQSQTTLNVFGKNQWLMCAPFLTVEQVDLSGSVVSSTSTKNENIVFAAVNLVPSTELIRVTINRNDEKGDVCGTFEFVRTNEGWVCTNNKVESVFILTEDQLSNVKSSPFGVQSALSNM